jgi:AcrR family transcriptional regulator
MSTAEASIELITSLEQIARRAGVGIGTLYRHFPNRQALVEALYVNEVEDLSRSAEQLDGLDPREALNSWFERLMGPPSPVKCPGRPAGPLVRAVGVPPPCDPHPGVSLDISTIYGQSCADPRARRLA